MAAEYNRMPKGAAKKRIGKFRKNLLAEVSLSPSRALTEMEIKTAQ